MSVKQGGNTIAGGGTVDQTYDGTSSNAQSGVAVAQALASVATVDQTYDGTSTNAQSGTAVAGAISNMVTTDTAQTISGFKTISNDNNKQMDVVCENLDLNNLPSSDNWAGIEFQDVNGTRIAKVEPSIQPDGTVRINISVSQPVSGTMKYGTLAICVKPDGTVFTVAPTPAASSNTENIGTTAWIKNFAKTSGANYMTTFSKAWNGYYKFTNGLIIQWGTSTKGSSKTVTLPTAFSSTNYKVVVNNQTNNGGGYYSSATTKTTTNFVIHSSGGAASFDNDWIAIGY